jgi:xanthine dehydrogenase accessory factor
VKCHCLYDSYENITFEEGEIVIIASHTSQDPELVKRALDQKASYVGMVGSYKRSLEVLNYLGRLNEEIQEPLYVPAGLDIDARNPDEIALSIVAEVIHES